ncbi:AraC-like DNA-binding protein [Paenibacillus turicensis]|uniref:AraC-like DNA-binding protein n=1 Tax=Paenibacillus turicensis TaxID=160487 RepID=A0ABS4FZI0_9BACL|nr:AraC family transcriptional regulator [Paenibacillus turicensis]MBP1907768.1 AraC-like DNA-binding protein [Paenibacillus turicensis]
MRAYHENRLYSSKQPFYVSQFENFNFLAHWHTDVEVIYVCEGSIRIGINSESRLLHAGDIAICSSGDIHYYDSHSSTSTMILIIFHPSLIGCTGSWPPQSRFVSPFMDINDANHATNEQFVALPQHRQEITELILKMKQEVDKKEPYYENVTVGMIHTLCGLLLRHIPSRQIDLSGDNRRILNMKIMQEVLDYLETNYMNGVKLEEAAKQAKMSLFHFSRFFKNITGMSYTSYLNRLRIDKAEEMIMSTQQTMLEIALECGFTNVRTFNRVFKQLKQCKPTDLRFPK